MRDLWAGRLRFNGGAHTGKGSRRAWERALCCAALAAQWIAFAGHAQQLLEAPSVLRTPDVRYEPSGGEVVRAMLQLGKVTARDIVYDLGCGDGRIVIAAPRSRRLRRYRSATDRGKQGQRTCRRRDRSH